MQHKVQITSDIHPIKQGGDRGLTGVIMMLSTCRIGKCAKQSFNVIIPAEMFEHCDQMITSD